MLPIFEYNPWYVTLFLLIFAHSLADYPLQGDFLAQGKNRNTPVGKMFWPYCLSSHAIIHAGFVLLITGNITFAIAEFFIHGITDWLKCENKINMFVDQFIHYACKFAYVAIIYWW
ncbi:DUF3307 domain-containing protein [Ralstonia phage RP13]|nr:DUF3307 domain-containing protein [Ralstonia phage RP13]